MDLNTLSNLCSRPINAKTGLAIIIYVAVVIVVTFAVQNWYVLTLLTIVGLLLLSYVILLCIDSARHLQAGKEQKASIENELRIAGDIQKALIPQDYPAFPERNDVDIFGRLTPAKQVSGDLYDYFIRDEKLFFCIGDVSGKGIPASLMMAVTRTLFRNVSAHEAMPHRILSAINKTLSEDNPNSVFVTFFLGVLDLPTGKLRYCNAGHTPPIIVGGDTLKAYSNLPLGAMYDWRYTPQEMTISAGTTIFLFTDGLTEAENADHQAFGAPRMSKTIESVIAKSTANEVKPRDIIDGLDAAVQAFVADTEQSDDLTMLAVKYTREQHEVRLQQSITLQNDVNQVPKLADFIDGICRELDLDSSAIMQLNLSVEEAVVNVMNYAYPEYTVGDILIEAVANEERLKFTITDGGTPFDPTTYGEADTTLSAEERRIGGLGIHLIRKYMDSINYERIDNKNILTLRKKLKH